MYRLHDLNIISCNPFERAPTDSDKRIGWVQLTVVVTRSLNDRDISQLPRIASVGLYQSTFSKTVMSQNMSSGPDAVAAAIQLMNNIHRFRYLMEWRFTKVMA